MAEMKINENENRENNEIKWHRKAKIESVAKIEMKA